MRTVTIGKYAVPLWLIIVIVISGIVVSSYVIYNRIELSFEVKEPLEILSYPETLSLFSGETEEIPITIMNHASIDYFVSLNYTLDDEEYQNSYVTFIGKTFRVKPGEQNLTVLVKIKSSAPPIESSLTVDFTRTEELEPLFFDDFNDGTADGWTEHFGGWSVINGEYFATVNMTENGFASVNSLDFTDCVIEVDLRFRNTSVGFNAGILFRYTDNIHYYNYVLSNEYDNIVLNEYSSDYPEFANTISGVGEGVRMIQENVDYSLKVVVEGNTFTCYLDGEEVLSGTDDSYSSGKVGLWARRADVYFDDFKVTEIA